MPHRTSHILSGQYNIHFGGVRTFQAPASSSGVGCAFPGFRVPKRTSLIRSPRACQLTCLSRAYFSGARARSARAGARAAPGAREWGALAATRRPAGGGGARRRRVGRRADAPAHDRQTDRQTGPQADTAHGARGRARARVLKYGIARRAPRRLRARRARAARAPPQPAR